MNRLGGLIRGLPWTAVCFLTGSLAIAGLPPLNGFVSEWLLFQSLLARHREPGAPGGSAHDAGRRGPRAHRRARRRRVRQGLRDHVSRDSALAGRRARARGARCRCGSAWESWPRRALGLGLAAVLILPALAAALAGSRGDPGAGAAARLRAHAVHAGGFARCHRSWWPSGLVLTIGGAGWGFGSSGARRRAPRQRHVGLRARGPDAADGVHVDRLRRAPAPRVRRAVPADPGSLDRLPSRFEVLRAVHRVPERDRPLVRALPLRAARRLDAAVGPSGPGRSSRARPTPT